MSAEKANYTVWDSARCITVPIQQREYVKLITHKFMMFSTVST